MYLKTSDDEQDFPIQNSSAFETPLPSGLSGLWTIDSFNWQKDGRPQSNVQYFRCSEWKKRNCKARYYETTSEDGSILFSWRGKEQITSLSHSLLGIDTHPEPTKKTLHHTIR